MVNVGETVLIVDDSRLQRMILRGMLEKNFRIIEAANGGECIDIVEHSHGKIDLILLDLVMPGIDGFEVLRRRRELPYFQEIPVIVLTMSETEEDQLKTFELGADEFILKPIQGEIACSRINNVLKAQRRLKALQKEQEKLKVKTRMDEMTKLYNKVTTQNMAQRMLVQRQDALHALMIVDIDNFKAINDIHGHRMGDHTICVVANVLSTVFRQEDIVGRIGGDEFLILMCDAQSKEAAWSKAQEVIHIMCEKENFSIPDEVTVSIGLAFSDGGKKDFQQLFQEADEAMYCSKNEGKGRVAGEGVHEGGARFERTILIWDGSRELCSTAGYIGCGTVQVKNVTDLAGLSEYVLRHAGAVLALYVDVSRRQDDGREMWEALDARDEFTGIWVVAVCAEGNMEQMRAAVRSDCVSDLMLSPVSPDVLKRRMNRLLEQS